MKDVIVGTAGHIDHGKTTLLKALTGIDADRLEEEKRRGITIDIGFAHMELGAYRVGFIDVPGHERFIKNMLAGIGGIHLVLLVVAADESVMPQTVEHFEICKLLEIPTGMVVLTKKSQVEAELLELVEDEVKDLVAGSFLEDAPIVAVDSLNGDGIEEFKPALLRQIESLGEDHSARSSERIFRLPIDRVFTIRGFGTIVTGTPNGGTLAKEDPIAVYPSGKEGKVRGIEVFGRKEKEAKAGQRAALNVTGLEKADLERGMVLSPPSSWTPSHMFDVVVQLLADSPNPLRHRSPVRFHQGSDEIMGRVYLLGQEELTPGGSGLAQLRLERPTVCCPLDHFILRRYSPLRTIAGGVILDNQPGKHRPRDAADIEPDLERLKRLWECGDANLDSALIEHFVRCGAEAGITLPALVARTGLVESRVRLLLQQMPKILCVPQDPLVAVYQPAVEALQERITDFLTRFHQQNPLSPGISREELKKKLLPGAAGGYFQFLIQAMEKERKVQMRAGTVSLHGRRVELNEEQNAIRTRVLSLFKSSGLLPPTLSQVQNEVEFPNQQVGEIYYYLLQTGELIRISTQIVLSKDQVNRLYGAIQNAFPPGTTFTVSQFKDLLGLTRKFAIPFLEFLDRRKVTKRVADKRIVL